MAAWPRVTRTVCGGMAFRDPPRQAAWRHREALDGFEVVLLRSQGGGWLLEGDTAAVEEGEAYAVRYAIEVDGEPAPHLDGVLDVDLESSALTNAFPVHRLDYPGIAIRAA